MAKRTTKRGKAAARPAAKRSTKASAPPEEIVTSARVRRRQKSAHVALSKGTTVFQVDRGPRAAWPASPKMRKKR